MKHTHLFTYLFVSVALLLGGCANIEITKRRHLPGYHVELGSKKQLRKSETETAIQTCSGEDELQVMPTQMQVAELPTSSITEELPQETAYASAKTVNSPTRKTLIQKADALLVEPFRELKQEKIGGELRRSVFNDEEGDQKYRWSGVAIVSFILGAAALAMMLIALFSIVFTFITISTYWFIPAVIGFALGLAALITGAIGMRKTGRSGKRGRGFAIAGLISGIIGMIASLIIAVLGILINYIEAFDAID